EVFTLGRSYELSCKHSSQRGKLPVNLHRFIVVDDGCCDVIHTAGGIPQSPQKHACNEERHEHEAQCPGEGEAEKLLRSLGSHASTSSAALVVRIVLVNALGRTRSACAGSAMMMSTGALPVRLVWSAAHAASAP